jgi:hypothetical protein
LFCVFWEIFGKQKKKKTKGEENMRFLDFDLELLAIGY